MVFAFSFHQRVYRARNLGPALNCHASKEVPMTISDALHRLLLDNLTTATILLDAELRLEYMNPAAEMLLAVSGQRSHGQFISELFT